MPNINYFIKLFNNLKSKKFIIFIIIVIKLLIILLILFFINCDSSIKIIEGNTNCKYSKQEKMEKDVEAKANRYKKENNTNPSVGGFGVNKVLSSVDDLKSKKESSNISTEVY